MGTLDLELYGPQFEFVGAEEHYLAFVAGLGSGKTIAGSMRSLAASQGWIGAQRIRWPNLGMVTAPTYPMLRDATLRTFLDIADTFIRSYNKSEHHVVLRNGSEILFRSTEHPERLRGPSLSWWYGDEAALYQAKVWSIMLSRLRQFSQHGWAWLTTTPKGRNWIWQKFVQQARAGYRILRASTLQNPYLHPEFVAGLLEEFVGDFALQELWGEFVAFAGLIYSEFNRLLHMTTERKQRDQFKRVVAGVDWGLVHPGVILLYGEDYDGRLWGLHEEYARQRQIDEWVRLARDLNSTYNISTFFCDPSEPLYIQKFVDAGLKAEGANNEVNPGIQAVKRRLVKREDGRPRILYPPEFVWTMAEKEQYQWRANPQGDLTDQPMKANDHCSDAERYCVMGVDQPKVRPIVAETSRYA